MGKPSLDSKEASKYDKQQKEAAQYAYSFNAAGVGGTGVNQPYAKSADQGTPSSQTEPRLLYTTTSSGLRAQFPGAVYVRGLGGPSDDDDEGTIVIGGHDSSLTTDNPSDCNNGARHHPQLVSIPSITATLSTTSVQASDLQQQRSTMSSADHGDNDDAAAWKHKRKLCFLCFVLLLCIGMVIAAVIVLVQSKNNNTISTTATTTFAPSHSIQPSMAPVSLHWILSAEIVASNTSSFGFHVDMNEDGTRVAISSPKAQGGRGQVEVYESAANVDDGGFDDNEWMRLGKPIIGDEIGDDASYGMDLSKDGQVLAVGYPGNGNGFVRVFSLDNKDQWKQRGQTLGGPSLDSKFGTTIALNKDGTFLAVGAPWAGPQEEGMFQAYKWTTGGGSSSNGDGGTWESYGDARYGERSGDHFATSVSMNDAGDRIVVGVPNDDSKWDDGGRVHLFGYNVSHPIYALNNDDCGIDDDDCWSDMVASLESTAVGENAGERLGHKVAITGDGTVFVSSSTTHNDDVTITSSSSSGTIITDESYEDDVGIVHVFQYDSGSASVRPIGFGTTGSWAEQGLGYDVDIYFGFSSTILFGTTSVNEETQTGVGRIFGFDSDDFRQMGDDIGPLPLGSGTWLSSSSSEGLSSSSDRHHHGPSISMANSRKVVAMGYQSVIRDGGQQNDVGMVGIYRLEEMPI